ncbi:MAG: hypothetical protein ACP5T4_03820, partial [Candidatus Micrarchaeia archaeon]
MRSQSALEFLTTYGWSFIIIAMFLSMVLVLVSSKGATAYAPSSCYISPSLPCTTAYFASNSIGTLATIIFTNQLGTELLFPQNSITIKATLSSGNYTGTCVPALANDNAKVVCTASMNGLVLSPGIQVNAAFALHYSICQGGTCSSYVYNTSGTATATVSAKIVSQPASTIAYVPITITNSQSTATPAPFQQMIQFSESTYSGYIAYNGNIANFEFFYANGATIPAWIESNNSGTITVWLKLANGVP